MIWAIENFRHDPAIMPKTLKPGRLSKIFPSPRANNPRLPPHGNTDRNLVPRRGPDRAKDEDTRLG